MQKLVGQVCKKNQKKKFLVYLGPYIRFLRPDAQNMYGAGVQLFFALKVPHLGAQICTRLSTKICTRLSIKSAFFLPLFAHYGAQNVTPAPYIFRPHYGAQKKGKSMRPDAQFFDT